MNQEMQRQIRSMTPLQRWLIFIIGGAFTLLTIGGYAFNWTWTGFHGNTLWDWLQLLVLPTALTAITIWCSGNRTWRNEWMAVLIGIALVMLVFVIGGYGFNWTWTGFHGNTLWDWIKLLLLPSVLTIASVWFTSQQNAQALTTPVATSPTTPRSRSHITAIDTSQEQLLQEVANAVEQHLTRQNSALIAVIHIDHLPQVLAALKADPERVIIQTTAPRNSSELT